jgi:hypothetical protein
VRGRISDHAGKRYGALVALRDVGSRQKSHWWECRCDCGNLIVVKSYDLGPSRGRKSCGCLNKTIGDMTRIHGMSKHPAHNVWSAMLNRCYRKKDPGYKNYGARGITVCARWRKSFVNFWEDMGSSYASGLTLERKNNDLGYSKSNCYWATRFEQGQNKRNNLYIDTIWGKLIVSEAARRYGLERSTLTRRLKASWDTKDLFRAASPFKRFS